MKRPFALVAAAVFGLAIVTVSIWSARQVATAHSAAAPEDAIPGTEIRVVTPLGLPPVPVPADNPITAKRVALGHRLFYEKRLSADDTVSCASCHNPLFAFADTKVRSIGVAGKLGDRNAITVVNAAYDPVQFWDGRAASLEKQVCIPMEDPREMNQPHAIAVSKLEKDAAYREQFQSAFGAEPITIDKIEQAIASFERTLVSGDSPFDRYQFGGDKSALSAAAVRGLAIFEDPKRGNCAACHIIGSQYALLTDGKFHNTGVGVDAEGDLTDLGRYLQTKIDADKGAFKTPSLRNVAQTAPYMHDGSLKTLKDVVDFYAGGGNSNPYLDKNMKVIHLSASERADLVEFLKSLSGEMPANAGPLQAEK